MTRREERELAFTTMFEYGFDPEFTPIQHYERAIGEGERVDRPFVREVLGGIYENLEKIDAIIDTAAVNWKRERISRVSMAALRLAVYEMLCREDVPLRVSLNEALEISKKFDEENAYRFVNGILNQVMQSPEVVGEK